MMKHKLEMPLEQFAEAVAKENERLISGPGGIMELKQTIADKEKRIEKLEAVLQEITESARLVGDYYHVKIAREALEDK
jgi:L-lactate utilization protein LutB